MCRHEAKIAELEQNCSAQSQLLQATRNTCDLTVSSLRKQLQQEADQKRATYQVHLAPVVTLAAVLWYCHVYLATDTFISAMTNFAVHFFVAFL